MRIGTVQSQVGSAGGSCSSKKEKECAELAQTHSPQVREVVREHQSTVLCRADGQTVRVIGAVFFEESP